MSEILYNTSEDEERLQHEGAQDCAWEYLDGIERDHWPEKLTVLAWRRKVMEENKFDPESVVEFLLESWDEEYGGSDDDPDITEPMLEAARVFLAAMRREYVVWQCERSPKDDVVIQVKGNPAFDDASLPWKKTV